MYIKLIEPLMQKRPMDTDLKIRMSSPLGLYTIANMFRKEHKVVVQNECVENITFDSPDIVGIMVTVNALPRAMEISQKFRANGSKVIAGGIHITTAWQTIPQGSFDALCVGAAEGTWPDIVKDVGYGKLKDIYFCHSLKGEDIVSPAYDMIPKEKYLYRNIIHTSRGCPFKCDFCYNSGKMHQYLRRPIPDVIKEIKMATSRHIMFIDDNFTGDMRWVRQFMAAIKPLHLKWNAACSINIVDHPDVLDLMREAGCQSLFIGFESVSPASIKSVHKVQNDTDKYEFAVRELHKRGIMVNASFVFGLDSDTPETFRYTLDWIVRNKIETVTSHILTPYPGTVVYDEFKRAGRLITNDLSLYDTAHVVFKPKKLTPEQLYEGYLWIYQQVYSFKNICRRMPDQKSLILPYMTFNILYRKFGHVSDAICKIVGYERYGRMAEHIAKYL